MMPKLPIPEGDRFSDSLKFRRLGTGSGDVLYECWESAVRAIQEEAYKAGMAAELERCANHLLASASRLAPEGKRTNQVDRHVADVLAAKAAELSEVK